MIELLLAAQLSCSDGYWILDGIENTSLSVSEKAELKLTVLDAMPDNCDRKNHAPRSRNRKALVSEQTVRVRENCPRT